jgi:hypothetical protein
MQLTQAEGLSSSHAVFTGEVTAIEPNQATRFGGLEVTFRVQQLWKGEPQAEIKVRTAGSSAACGYTFAKGSSYLVYAVRDDADPLRVSLCSRTAPIENAKDDLRFLGKPSHKFDGSRGRSGTCAAGPLNADGPGLGLLALLLIGATLAVRRGGHILVGAVLIVSVFGCSSAPSKPALMANMAKEDVTVTQLRAINYEYAAHFAQLVAMSVTDIVAETDDPQVRERAYQWRMWAAPEARSAAFDQDPFVGLLELWILAAQQRAYFTEGDGKNYFGEQQRYALATTRKLEEEAGEIIANIVSDKEREKLYTAGPAWVKAHPIEGQLFVRSTARASLAGLVPQEKQGGLKAVGSIEETFRDLNDRITILTVQMPVEARWQAEYLTNSLFEERVKGPTDSMLGTMQTMTDFLGEFEGTLAAQTTTLLDGFTRERIAVFDAVEEERKEILAAIEQERASIMGKLDDQLRSATTEFDEVGRSLIDHFFVRLIEVLAMVGIASVLTVLLVLVVLRRRKTSND